MRFRTIIITRNKIAVFSLCAAAAASLLAGGAVIRSHRAREVFNEDKLVYEEMLEEGLPTEKSASVKDMIKKLIGFGSEEEIIAEMSPVLQNQEDISPGGENEHDAPENNAPPETDESPDEAQNADTSDDGSQNGAPALPSKEEVSVSRGIEVSNASNYTVDADSACAEDLSFTIDNSGPQVLIVHTHTTECYLGDEMSASSDRSADESKNVAAVGNVICEVLEGCGISCVHDTTVHDYPSYQGAYTRALGTISANLDKYPSIKIVLDIHRDAFVYPDGSKLKVSFEENGVNTAKVMIVAGTDSMGLSFPSWRENFKLAAKIQNAAQIMYPGLMRPINLRRERFNMHMTAGSLLLEIGSNGNTLDEAKRGAREVAYAIAAAVK